MLNHQIFMAYNDSFRRGNKDEAAKPSEIEESFYRDNIRDLLNGIEQSADYELFHAELLREIGRFEEAKDILMRHTSEEDKWVVDAMLRHIEDCDTFPFLLIENGNQVC